jgi:trimeric autotransporter adhesin
MRITILLLASLVSIGVFAQQSLNVHQGNTVDTHILYEGDSLYFDADHTTLYFANNGSVLNYLVASVDSLTFTTDIANNVYIHYDGSNVVITNPMANNGVDVTNSNGMVTVVSNSLVQDINYVLSGTSTNGNFKVYSEKRYNVLLNSVSLTNPIGPALNLQSTKKATIHLLSGSNNHLADGAAYDPAPMVGNIAEDQKATLFCEADLEFIGSGILLVTSLGSEQHGIASDEEINVKEGQIEIVSAARDGIHASEGYDQMGGDVVIHSSGDGVDAELGKFEMICGDLQIFSTATDVKAVRSDSLVVINGGWINVSSTGNQSKGIDCAGDILIHGGVLEMTTSGLAVLIPTGQGNDPAYCSLITADDAIEINGGTLNLVTTGKGGRAISGNGDVWINGGDINITCSGAGQTYTNSSGTADAYHSTCIKVDGDLHFLGGEFTGTNSGSGGKGIDVDGAMWVGDGTNDPLVSITTTGTSITISGGGGGGGGGNNGVYDECKAVNVEGNMTMASGHFTSDSNDDGIKCGATITMNGGVLNIADSKEGIEAPFITINDGEVSIKASDDGFNATHGSGGEGSDGSMLAINGGYCFVNASGGDALDSNGNISMTGGVAVVHGPQSSPEVGMDYNGTSLISGGFIVISGTNSNMTQGFGTASAQRSLTMKTTQSIAANTIVHVEDADGNEIFTFKPMRPFYSIVFSSPLITQGTSYTLYTGGSSTGTALNGLVSGGTYSPGTNEATFNVTNVVTTVNF